MGSSSTSCSAGRVAGLVTKSTDRPRRIWDLLGPFGFEVSMLLLHLHTLEPFVHGFLVTESPTVITSDASKPLILTDMISRGELPQPIRRKLDVSVVNFNASTCRSSHAKCMEMQARFALLQMLFARAEPRDVAFLCDTDEILRPSTVQLFARCDMFDPQLQPRQPWMCAASM